MKRSPVVRSHPRTHPPDAPWPEIAPDLRSLSDRAAFHLAGIGASVIGAASRLRETGDFACSKESLKELGRDLQALDEMVRLVESGSPQEAMRLLDDLADDRVLRRLA